MGNYGCYVLCLLDVAEEYLGRKFSVQEKFNLIQKAIDKKYIFFDESDYQNSDNFFVQSPHLILGLATGRKWIVEKKPANYKPRANEYAVEYWQNGRYGHFARLCNGFNSLQKSNCVDKGKITSYRIFREI